MLTRVISLGVMQQEPEPDPCQPERVMSFRAPPGLLRAVSNAALGDKANGVGFVDVACRCAAFSVPTEPAPYCSMLPGRRTSSLHSIAVTSRLANSYKRKPEWCHSTVAVSSWPQVRASGA